ncbi:hypothetical protein Z043_111781, partial [Scleropages formosus]
MMLYFSIKPSGTLPTENLSLCLFDIQLELSFALQINSVTKTCFLHLANIIKTFFSTNSEPKLVHAFIPAQLTIATHCCPTFIISPIHFIQNAAPRMIT